MKSITVRVPDELDAELEAESRRREMSKSDIVRERLQREYGTRSPRPKGYELIADLVGINDEPPSDLSGRKKHYLKALGFGRKRSR